MSPLIKTLIEQECNAVKELLLAKNEAYGNSALDPLRIFAAGMSAEAQIRVRIDDKLCRIRNGAEQVSEDTERDLIGYLILLRVHRKWTEIDQEARCLEK